MKKLRAAIVGCGRISVCYEDAFHRLSDQVELVYAVDKNPELAKAFAEKFGSLLLISMKFWIKILTLYIFVFRTIFIRSWPSRQ